MFTPGMPKKHPMEMDPGMDEGGAPEEAQDAQQSPKMEAIMELMKFLQQGESKAIQPRLPKPAVEVAKVDAAPDSGDMSPEMMDALKKMME